MAQRKKNVKKKKKQLNRQTTKKKEIKNKKKKVQKKVTQSAKNKSTEVKKKSSEVKKKTSAVKKETVKKTEVKKVKEEQVKNKVRALEQEELKKNKKNQTTEKIEKKVEKKVPKKVKETSKKIEKKKLPDLEVETKRKEIIEEVFEEEKKVVPKKRKFKLKWLFFVFFLGGLVVLYQFPYGVSTHLSEASKKRLDVPKFMKLSEECCNYNAIFSGPRSYDALKKEMEKIISQYEILDCDGKHYYYNREQDYTITEYGFIKGKIFNKVYINYGIGNSCSIDTQFRKLELLPNDYSLKEARKDGNYVIDQDTIYNKETYYTFQENVKQKIPSTLRIVSTVNEGEVVITDIEYLSDGKFKVVYDGTRNSKSNEKGIIAVKYNHLGVSKGKLYAYNGDEVSHGYFIMKIPE
ncbi:MAG: hypothetical protein HFJ02_04530 [Bacilli bacterium]|nr:hypothetical protein [Bacilli bacterium]